MPTLSELLTSSAPTPHRDPAMPVRLPGGGMVRPEAKPAPLPPIAGIAPAAAPAPRVLGGGRRRGFPAPKAVPGGVPGVGALPHVPGAPIVPEPAPVAAPGAAPAPKVVTLFPNAFADTWKLKPKGPVEIGLRLIADGDLDRARSYAAKIAADIPDGNPDVRVEAYNETLMQWAVARATCKPEDARQDFWKSPQDVVALALTDDGLKLLFHELLNLKIERSPLQSEARDADLVEFGQLLASPAVREILATLGEPRLRRHLAWLRDEVRTLAGPGHLPGTSDEGLDPATFPTGPVVGED